MRTLVAQKLAQDWSPEQISGWLARTHPGEQALQVSTETIYRSLFVQARGVLRKELTAHLRRSSNASRKGEAAVASRMRCRSDERSPAVEDRAVPGHWEGDLIAGSGNTHIATLVERQSHYLMLVKVDGKDTTSVVDALTAQVKTLPAQLRASLTWDRGMELADHEWQRGTNENTNGLLRQYVPKKTATSRCSVRTSWTSSQRSSTPDLGKTLDFDTPAAKFGEIVASTP